MPVNRDNIKAEVVDRLRSIPATATPTARLLAILDVLGVDDQSEAASLIGRSVRMVQMARNQLRETHCAEAKPIAQGETHCAKPIAPAKPTSQQSETNFASPARGVVPNPTTVEIVTTQDRSPSPLPPYSPPIPSSPSRKCDPDGVTWDANSKTILLDDGNRAFWLDLFEGDRGI